MCCVRLWIRRGTRQHSRRFVVCEIKHCSKLWAAKAPQHLSHDMTNWFFYCIIWIVSRFYYSGRWSLYLQHFLGFYATKSMFSFPESMVRRHPWYWDFPLHPFSSHPFETPAAYFGGVVLILYLSEIWQRVHVKKGVCLRLVWGRGRLLHVFWLCGWKSGCKARRQTCSRLLLTLRGNFPRDPQNDNDWGGDPHPLRGGDHAPLFIVMPIESAV